MLDFLKKDISKFIHQLTIWLWSNSNTEKPSYKLVAALPMRLHPYIVWRKNQLQHYAHQIHKKFKMRQFH
jgi:hypothetical protein